jgi:hypothetical protein|tara:strand:- start:5834 stop:6034 length:201 start_codon:yes stop_codon:yes gene_type:complete
MIVTDDDCCKLILEETNLHEKKAGYIIKFKQLCEKDGLWPDYYAKNYWCLTHKEAKAVIRKILEEI